MQKAPVPLSILLRRCFSIAWLECANRFELFNRVEVIFCRIADKRCYLPSTERGFNHLAMGALLRALHF